MIVATLNYINGNNSNSNTHWVVMVMLIPVMIESSWHTNTWEDDA